LLHMLQEYKNKKSGSKFKAMLIRGPLNLTKIEKKTEISE